MLWNIKCFSRSKHHNSPAITLDITCIIKSATDNTAPCKTSLKRWRGGNIVSLSSDSKMSSVWNRLTCSGLSLWKIKAWKTFFFFNRVLTQNVLSYNHRRIWVDPDKQAEHWHCCPEGANFNWQARLFGLWLILTEHQRNGQKILSRTVQTIQV